MPDLGEALAFGAIGLVLLGAAFASTMVKRTFHSVMFLGVALVAVGALFILLGSPLIGVIQILVYVGGILTLFVFAVMFVAGDEREQDAPQVEPRSRAWFTLAALACVAASLFVAFRFMGLAYGKAAALVSFLGTWANFVGFVAAMALLGASLVAALVAYLGARHVLSTWPAYRILGAGVSTVILAMLAGITLTTQAWDLSATDASQTGANDLSRVVDQLFGPQVVALEVLGVLLTAVMIGALVIARPLGTRDDAERYGPVTRKDVLESQRASDPRPAREGVAK
jgi:NADH-quinone oxidoreductase subunit J